ncbi:MAG TPA: hypothetical protein VNH46_11220, partial [Gemmatimonadales bacterium]|nr:hypothetical protein [Gemmatimonadales bacterium]
MPCFRRLAALAFLALIPACSNAGSDLGMGLPNGPGPSALVYIDRDFNAAFSAGDTTLAGATVWLIVAGTHDTVASAATDAAGIVSFGGVTPGAYTVAVDSALLQGDSLVSTLTPASVTVVASGPPAGIQVRLGYPMVSVAQARARPPGSRVVVSGIIVAGRQTFADTTAYLRGVGAALRLLSVVNLSGGPTNLPGDTVRVLGTVAARDGQPVLDSARVFFLTQLAPPVPDTVTTAQAATARGGVLDADLVTIVGATIAATTTQGADLVVTLDDGSGSLDLVIDSNVPIAPGPFIAGATVDAT